MSKELIEQLAKQHVILKYLTPPASREYHGTIDQLEAFAKAYQAAAPIDNVAVALKKAAKLLESQRFMALDSTKTYTAEEYRQGLKSSVAFLAKQIRKLIPYTQANAQINAEGVE